MSSKKKKSGTSSGSSSSGAGPSKQALPEGLEKLLICGKCEVQYDLTTRKPKLLVCHHCFCMVCIETFIKTKDNKTAQCPTCSKITSIGRSGVAGLPNNEYLLPQLKFQASVPLSADKRHKNKKAIIVEEDEEEEDNDSYDYGYYDEACGGDFSAPRRSNILIFCQTCLNTANPTCLTDHTICNYESGVKELQDRLKDSVQKAGENLMNEVQLLEDKSIIKNRIQNAWLALGSNLEETTLSQTVSLSAAKALLDQLPSASLGTQAANHGDPTILARAVIETESIVSNCFARLEQVKEMTVNFNIISHCNVNVHMAGTADAPGDNFHFSLHLNDRTNDTVLCLMYSMTKMLESKRNHPSDVKGKRGQRTVEGASGSRGGYSAAVISGASTSGTSEWIKMKKGKGHDSSSSRRNDGMTAARRVAQPSPQTMSSGCKFCFFDLIKNVGMKPLGRVIMEINCKAAPKMSKNFLELCSGKHGFGYVNTHLWRVPAADHVDGGELPEGNEVTVFNQKPFYGDASPLQDEVGMLRMRGLGTEDDGQPIVGNSFMVWVRKRRFKSYARTLVFGKVREGLDILLSLPETRNKVINISKCGVLDSYP